MRKVLVVDDDEGILDALSAILEFEGYKVEVEDSAENVIERAKRVSPNIILLDLLLADGESGDKLVTLLKRDRATQKIPIIMISAHPKAEEQAKVAGADDFIAKPFDIDELLSKISSLTAQ